MANECPECGKGDLLLREVKPKVSAAGLFGAALALIGFGLLFFNPIVGVLMIGGGILIGYAGRGKKTEAVCPLCGYRKTV